MLKILNTMLKNVGYLENIETEALSELMKEEIRNPLFYDKIIDVEACLLAIKQNASSN